MENDFLHSVLGKTGIEVFRLGLSATYWPGKDTIVTAFDAGVNLFFGYSLDRQMVKCLKDIFQSHREKCVLVTGAYNLLYGHPNLRKSLEKRLKQFGTDYIDCFLFLGVMKPKQMKDYVFEELNKFKEEGKIRAFGLSCHDRKFLGDIAEKGKADVLMLRYNAAHPGAEQEVFPHLEKHDPGVIGYTATRWGFLLKKPKKGWDSDRIPTPGECYRFVLSNPHVDVVLSAPRTKEQFLENLSAIKDGPLSEEDMRFMYDFGKAVHNTKKWFM